jgi:type IV pilus assembly protein PilV
MVKVLPNPAVSAEGGSTMIEVLVAIVVLTLGLLGLAGLQARLQVSEMEAYQRSQALILVSDMASRLAANRAGAAAYAAAAPVSGPLGPSTCPTATGTQAERDIRGWCEALQGASETKASGTVRVGTLVGGRGCVENLGAGDYRVTVTWQGLVPIAERALGSGGASPLCGNNAYAGGTSCTGNLCRRYVTMLVRVPTL